MSGRTISRTIRFTADGWTMVQAAAESQSCTPSQFVREAVLIRAMFIAMLNSSAPGELYTRLNRLLADIPDADQDAAFRELTQLVSGLRK